MGEEVIEGQLLAGKYRVERVLGRGGMGVVVAARHEQLAVRVALKFMTTEAWADAEMVSRFLREARAAARLRSEHVARVMDVGTLDSGAPYIVLEYLEGRDLAAWLAKDGPLAIGRAVELISQACDALAEAHRAGIVHRDIKPSNLFLTRRPNGTACVKVLDFGISKADHPGGISGGLSATSTHAVFGSPSYMAPEQMRSARDVDARADIWSLGATLYELLVGRVPFQGESLVDLVFKVTHDDPRPLREFRPDLPWGLEQVVLRCLEKAPEHRFASATQLMSALAPFAPAPGEVFAISERDLESSGDTQTHVFNPTSSDDQDQPTRAIDTPMRLAEVQVGVDPTRKSAEGAPHPKAAAGRPTPPAPPEVPEPSAVKPGPAPTPADGPVAGWRTGAVSWGRTHLLPARSGRVLWFVAVGATIVAVSTTSLLVLRAPGGPTEVRDKSIAAHHPVDTSSSVRVAPTDAGSPGAVVLAPLPEPTTMVPTVSVADLPVVVAPSGSAGRGPVLAPASTSGQPGSSRPSEPPPPSTVAASPPRVFADPWGLVELPAGSKPPAAAPAVPSSRRPASAPLADPLASPN
jgi:serine/threonine-protein kinase